MADQENTPPTPGSPDEPSPADIERALAEASQVVDEMNRTASSAPAGLDAASLAALGAELQAADINAGAPAGAATRGAAAAGVAPGATPQSPRLPDFDLASVGVSKKDIDLLSDVNLDVTIELGRTRMLISDVLKLGAGAVIELDKLAGDPVDVWVNERLVAKGEVLVLNDNFCVRINEIVDAASADKV